MPRRAGRNERKNSCLAAVAAGWRPNGCPNVEQSRGQVRRGGVAGRPVRRRDHHRGDGELVAGASADDGPRMSKSATPAKLDLVLEPDDAQRLVNLCGPFDAPLRQIELRLGIEIRTRGNRFQLVGARKAIGRGEAVLQQLFHLAADDTVTTSERPSGGKGG